MYIFNCRSAVFEMGNTKVIAAVYGPREVFNFEVNFYNVGGKLTSSYPPFHALRVMKT